MDLIHKNDIRLRVHGYQRQRDSRVCIIQIMTSNGFQSQIQMSELECIQAYLSFKMSQSGVEIFSN